VRLAGWFIIGLLFFMSFLLPTVDIAMKDTSWVYVWQCAYFGTLVVSALLVKGVLGPEGDLFWGIASLSVLANFWFITVWFMGCWRLREGYTSRRLHGLLGLLAVALTLLPFAYVVTNQVGSVILIGYYCWALSILALAWFGRKWSRQRLINAPTP
jgi:hypothetical protein